MSKGLEDFKELKKTTCFYCQYHINEECVNDKCIWNNVEKELKQAEENEKLLNIFKNALTIEYHDYPMVELDHNEDSVSYFVKQLYTIKQNEMDRDIKSNLREWLLKNAFPKELKALNIIRQNFKLVGNCLQAKNRYADSGWVFVKELENEEEHNAWKEVLLCR